MRTSLHITSSDCSISFSAGHTKKNPIDLLDEEDKSNIFRTNISASKPLDIASKQKRTVNPGDINIPVDKDNILIPLKLGESQSFASDTPA